MRHQLLLACCLALLGVGTVVLAVRSGGPTPTVAEAAPSPRSQPVTSPAATVSSSPEPEPLHPLVDRRTVGQPWGSAVGLLQFRGNPTRTWYGTGPAPRAPEIGWRYPDAAMCTEEVVGTEDVTITPPPPGPGATAPPPRTERRPITKRWCGSGWTGQPAVHELSDGTIEVVVGTYDGGVHFIDAETGRATRPPFATGDIIKGSVTLDPDGFPLLYTGSRDGYLRVLALDRPGGAVELWSLAANPEGMWNNDWDGNPSVIDGVLYTGGEDSWFYAIELNRTRDAEGRVQVEPRILVQQPGWTEELLRDLGDRNVSFESSVAIYEGRAYLANSGGRIVGYDISDVRSGVAPTVFDFWMGDDVDATIVIDTEGMLYVSAELERRLPRSAEVGQLVKLDPGRPDDPLVWSLAVPARQGTGAREAGGIWATPALHDGLLYVPTHAGDLLAVDTTDGEVVWREALGYHEWSSPVVVDDTLIVGACDGAGVMAWDVTDPRRPVPAWDVRLGGCVESTPAVWDGALYVGSRDGYIYRIADPT